MLTQETQTVTSAAKNIAHVQIGLENVSLELPVGFTARLLELRDASEVVNLRNTILTQLAHSDLYVRETDEISFVREHMSERGCTIGVEHDGNLVAYAMLGLPSPGDTGHLGRTIALPDACLDSIGYVASCMVAPGHRGLGLQKNLLNARQQLATHYQRSMLLGMVSLHNHPSRRNMMRAGFHIHWVGVLEGHLKRQIMFLDRRARVSRSDMMATSDGYWVAYDNYALQQELTNHGYRGITERGREGRFLIYFVKEQPRL